MSDANPHGNPGSPLDETDATAGEYVLGTLDPAERLAAETRLRADPQFRAAVAAWERRLQPLADSALPAAVPDALFTRIAHEIDTRGAGAQGGPPADVVELRREVGRWRLATWMATAAAVIGIAWAIGERMLPSVSPHTYVAVLASGTPMPAFVATLSLDSSTLNVRRLGDAAPADKSYQLWAIPPGQPPQSLGVMDAATTMTAADIGDLDPAGLTLAVSLEAKGGSTTGMPMGPVVFTGPLIAGN